MLKSSRIAVISGVFLLLGWTVPANARQDHKEKPSEQERSQQQDEPARQEQPQANRQQSQRRPQQQVQKPQQQARAQQQPSKEQPQKNNNAARQQQQAKGQQEQQHQQPQRQHDNPKQPQQEAIAPQRQRNQPQVASAQRPRRTQQAMATQRAQPALRLSVRGSGRIPDERFHSSFGREHEFHMGNPVMVGGYSRFQYGGYWFGFVQPWPVGWYYTDDVYIDYVDGGYYMFDPYYPGARFAISVVL